MKCACSVLSAQAAAPRGRGSPREVDHPQRCTEPQFSPPRRGPSSATARSGRTTNPRWCGVRRAAALPASARSATQAARIVLDPLTLAALAPCARGARGAWSAAARSEPGDRQGRGPDPRPRLGRGLEFGLHMRTPLPARSPMARMAHMARFEGDGAGGPPHAFHSRNPFTKTHKAS